MATLEQRIAALEMKKAQRMDLDIRTCTDEQILDFIGLSHDATDEQLEEILCGKRAPHGNT